VRTREDKDDETVNILTQLCLTAGLDISPVDKETDDSGKILTLSRILAYRSPQSTNDLWVSYAHPWGFGSIVFNNQAPPETAKQVLELKRMIESAPSATGAQYSSVNILNWKVLGDG